MNAGQTVAAAVRGEGCLGHAAYEEPVFVLRAHDRLAPLTLQCWAQFLETAQPGSAKAREARIEAERMIAWQAEHGSKLPD